MDKKPGVEDDIEPFDGFSSQRERDMAINKTRREATKEAQKKQQRTHSKLIKGWELDQENLEVLKETFLDNMRVHKSTILNYIWDINYIIEFVEKDSKDMSSKDSQYITSLREKRLHLLSEIDNIDIELEKGV